MMVYHLAYRVDKGPKQHIYAIKKICDKKKEKLQEEYGDRIKIYRLERAKHFLKLERWRYW